MLAGKDRRRSTLVASGHDGVDPRFSDGDDCGNDNTKIRLHFLFGGTAEQPGRPGRKTLFVVVSCCRHKPWLPWPVPSASLTLGWSDLLGPPPWLEIINRKARGATLQSSPFHLPSHTSLPCPAIHCVCLTSKDQTTFN